MSELNKKFLKHIIRRLEEMNISSDKIVVQKLTYYLKEEGLPISYNYEMHAYGPYAKELSSDADYLELENQLSIYKCQYKTGDKYKDELPENYMNLIDEKISKFRSLINNDFNFDSMEIFGTTLYCYNALKKIGIEPTCDKVIDEFKAWKGKKYANHLIQKCYEQIVGFINNGSEILQIGR